MMKRLRKGVLILGYLPSDFVAKRRVTLPFLAPQAGVGSGLASEEVLVCAPARNRTSNNGLEVRSYIHLTTGASEE
jgi:hypothetical protein